MGLLQRRTQNKFFQGSIITLLILILRIYIEEKGIRAATNMSGNMAQNNLNNLLDASQDHDGYVQSGDHNNSLHRALKENPRKSNHPVGPMPRIQRRPIRRDEPIHHDDDYEVQNSRFRRSPAIPPRRVGRPVNSAIAARGRALAAKLPIRRQPIRNDHDSESSNDIYFY